MAEKIRFTIVIERGPPDSNFSAYVPDLPGCVSTGRTLDEVKRNLAEAVTLHLHGMQVEGDPIPAPSTVADFVEVSSDPRAWSEGVVDSGVAQQPMRGHR